MDDTTALPSELLVIVASYISQKQTLRVFSLVSRELRAIALPFLYGSISISLEAAPMAQVHFVTYSNIAPFVKRLQVVYKRPGLNSMKAQFAIGSLLTVLDRLPNLTHFWIDSNTYCDNLDLGPIWNSPWFASLHSFRSPLPSSSMISNVTKWPRDLRDLSLSSNVWIIQPTSQPAQFQSLSILEMSQILARNYVQCPNGTLTQFYDESQLPILDECVIWLKKNSKNGQGMEVLQSSFDPTLSGASQRFLELPVSFPNLRFLGTYTITQPDNDEDISTYLASFLAALKQLPRLEGLAFQHVVEYESVALHITNTSKRPRQLSAIIQVLEDERAAGLLPKLRSIDAIQVTPQREIGTEAHFERYDPEKGIEFNGFELHESIHMYNATATNWEKNWVRFRKWHGRLLWMVNGRNIADL